MNDVIELSTAQAEQVAGGVDDYCGTLPWRPLHWLPTAFDPQPVPWLPPVRLPRIGG